VTSIGENTRRKTLKELKNRLEKIDKKEKERRKKMVKKKKKRFARQVGGLAVGVLGGAVGAHALGAVGTGLGGTAQTITGRGQAGLAGMAKFVPTAGKVIGVSVPLRVMHEAFPRKKIKKILR